MYYFLRVSEEQAARARAGVWPDTFDKVDALWPSAAWLRAFGFSEGGEYA
jgi:hypothetical protein